MRKTIISISFVMILLCSILGITPVKAAQTLNWPVVWQTDTTYLPPVTIGSHTWYDYSNVMPVLCDINGDGIQDVFVTHGYPDTTGYGSYGLHNDGSVWCLNGANGAIIWQYHAWNIGNHAVMSIHDLDGDGKPELLVCGYHNTTAFHANNGSILWSEMDGLDSDYYRHDKPAVVLKIDGVIYVYTCKNTAGAAGGIVKRLGSTGQIVASAPPGVYHPCYGGLSAADINGDGQIEILLGDRNTGVGVACYKSSDLSLIWSYPSVACSTQCPMLVDLNNDGYLDVLVCNQASHTLCAVNGLTGGQLFWNVCSGIPSDDGDTYNGAVYDMDKDGHLEYATAISSDMKVYDLSTYALDADIPVPHTGSGYVYTSSPIIANVIGDANSDMEIINQFVYQGVDIFDSTYTYIANAPLPSNTWSRSLTTTVVDMDNDGYNELIQLCHKDGTGSGTFATVQVVRTGGTASTTKATAKDQWYTFKRNILSQYVPYDDPDLDGANLTIYSYNPITSFRALPNISMPTKYISNNIHVKTCPGEYAPATFVLRSDSNVTVTLETQGFSWPADAIDIRVVKCWFQRGDNIYSNIPPTVPPGNKSTLLPELLLKNDSLVKVVGNEDYVFFNGSYHQVSHSSGAYGSTPRVNITDTPTLQPVALENNVNKQFWITVHPPNGTQANDYSGTILIKAGGQTIGTVNLKVTVLPFTLSDPVVDSSIYYTSRYSSTMPKGSLRAAYRSSQQLIAEFTDMKKHGITNPTVYQNYSSSASNFKIYMDARVAANISNDRIYYLGFSVLPTTNIALLKTRINATRDYLSNNYGTTELYFYGPDEQNMDTPEMRARVAAVHQCGCKIMNALGSVKALAIADVLDHCNLAYGPDFAPYGWTYTWYQSCIPTYHSYNHTIGIYAYPQCGEEKPLVYRTNYGLLLWQYDYDTVMDYAYMEGGGLLWDDWILGSPNYYKQHLFVYPTSNGVVDTVQYEGYREAINDIRYMTKLITVCQLVKDEGKNVSAIEAYVTNLKDWNSTIMKNIDLNQTRDQIISYIWDCCNFTSDLDEPPVFSGVTPSNGSINVPASTSSVNLTIKDPDGDNFNWAIQTSPNVGSISGNGASNGSKSCSISYLTYSTTYTWFVNATDGNSWTRAWYRFTTRSQYVPNPPSSFTATAANRTKINLAWTKGSKTDYTRIQQKTGSYPTSISDGTNVYNGTSTSCSSTGLTKGTTYYYRAWSWNTTDKVWSSSYRNASATTLSNHAPSVGSPDPANQSTASISLSSLSVFIQDSDVDNFDWNIETNPGIGSGSGTSASNGTKTCTLSGLQYSTTYHWYVNVTDGTGWTNASYIFTTESQPQNNQGSYGGNPPGNEPTGEEEPEQNQPPNTPTKPSGQTSAKQGIVYNYTSLASDQDGNCVRLRFDWGDGTLSNWSSFVSSNTSVTVPHVWNSISTYNVRVIAQDENNTNSSWSVPLPVTVSQAVSAGEPTVGDIKTSSNISSNQTVQFDASGSFDPNVTIVSYEWDFGDGETGTGAAANHTYKNSGQYTVTLVITDNTGKTYAKSIIVTVGASAEEKKTKEKQDFLSSYLIIILTVILIVVVLLLTLYFRGKKRAPLLESRTTQEEKKVKEGEENKSLFSAPPHEDIIEKKT